MNVAQEIQPSFWEQIRLAFAFVWRVVSTGPTTFFELVMAGGCLWFGAWLLLPVASFSARAPMAQFIEPYVGAWFVVLALYKLVAMSAEHGHLTIAAADGMVDRAAGLILFSWVVMALYYWSLSPWSSAMSLSLYPAIVQGGLFVRRAARRGP